MEVRLTRSVLGGALVIAFLIGLAAGTAMLVWQRADLSARVQEAEKHAEEARTRALGTASDISALRAGLQSAEATVASLLARNSKLASDLAAAQAASKGEAPAGKTGPVTFLSRDVNPATTVAGGPITLTVKIKGTADKVRMRIVARSGGGFDKTYSLSRVASAAGGQTWRATVNAPSDPGEYRYYATAYQGTSAYPMAGVSAWTFLVQGP